MSSVPEVIAAVHMGARVLGISCCTNLAAGISPHELSHAEVKEAADRARPRFVALVSAWIERAVVDVIRAAKTECAVHAFDHRAVRRVRALAPSLRTGILLDSYLMDPVGALRAAEAQDYWQQWRGIAPQRVQRVHGARGRVIAWTVNARADAAALTSLGVDGLCTDDIPAIVQGLPMRAQ